MVGAMQRYSLIAVIQESENCPVPTTLPLLAPTHFGGWGKTTGMLLWAWLTAGPRIRPEAADTKASP